NLQNGAFVGAITKINTVTGRPSRDHAMQFSWNGHCRARLLAGQTEFTNFYWFSRITKIIDLCHAANAPIRSAGDEKGNTSVALPPTLMGILEAFQADDQL